jgi:sugar porter (SP) family MFS transporter
LTGSKEMTSQTAVIETRRLNSYLVRSALVAGLGGLLFGFDTAVIAGATGALARTFQLSAASLGITVSSALWGTVIGSLVAGWFTDRFGRRACLRGLAVLYVLTAVGCAVAWNWPSFVLSRAIGGLAIGGSSVIGPMYIAEVAPASKRGRLVALFQFNIVSGILAAYLSNYLVGLASLPGAEWRWKLGVAAVPAVLFLVALFTIPESPRWLIVRGRTRDAREVFMRIGETDPDRQVADVVRSVTTEGDSNSEPLFRRKYRFPIFLAVSLGMFNQLSGINAILYYANDIFERAGFSKGSGDLQAVAIGATNFLLLLVAMTLIDRIGRKRLLLIGAVGTALCLAGVAWVFLSGRHENWLVWLLVGDIGFFSLSQGAVIWVYLSEVFPNLVRAKGQSLGSSTHWIMNALVSMAFPIVAANSGGLPFAFFSAMMVVQFFVVLFVYPETRGVALEQMEQRLGLGASGRA